jgi:hypothetical protein
MFLSSDSKILELLDGQVVDIHYPTLPPTTREILLAMSWEEFSDTAYAMGWEPGSPELRAETVALMVAI